MYEVSSLLWHTFSAKSIDDESKKKKKKDKNTCKTVKNKQLLRIKSKKQHSH